MEWANRARERERETAGPLRSDCFHAHTPRAVPGDLSDRVGIAAQFRTHRVCSKNG
jgi:hypothetical protein